MPAEIERPTLPRRPSRRRLFQFGFRTLLLLVAAAAVGSLLLKRWSADRPQPEVMPDGWDVETGLNVKWRVWLGNPPYRTLG